MNLQTTLITTLIAFILGILLSLGITWSYQKSKYEAIIATNEANYTTQLNKSLTDLNEANIKLIENERNNQNVTAKLEQDYLEATKKLSSLRINYDKLLWKYDGLRFKSAECSSTETTTTTPSQTTTSTATTTGNNGACQLPRAASEFIILMATEASRLSILERTCFDYATAIEKQREQMIKEQNNAQ